MTDDKMSKALRLQQQIEAMASGIEEIRIALLRPGDVVLVMTPEGTLDTDLSGVLSTVQSWFPDNDVRVCAGISIEVVRPTCERGHIRTWTSAVCQVCGDLQEDPPPASLTADPDMIIDREIS
jgi:hypothetical protein